MSFTHATENLRNFQRRAKELAREKLDIEKTRAEQAQIGQEQNVRALALLRQADRLEQQRREQQKVAEYQAAVEARQRATEQRQAKTEAIQKRTAATHCDPKWVLQAIFAGLPPVISVKHSFGVTLANTISAIRVTNSLEIVGKACAVESKGLLLNALRETADPLPSVSNDVPEVVEVQPSTSTPTQTTPAVKCAWLKKSWKRASKFCEMIGANVQAIGKKRKRCSNYLVLPAIQSRASLRELTVEETAAWDAFMALSNSLNSAVISRLVQEKADIFQLVQPEVLADFDSCVKFLMGQSDKAFKSALNWFRVPPPPAEIQRLTTQRFKVYATEVTNRGHVLQPNLVATYLKRLLRKVNAGVITPSMQAFIAELKPSEANAASIAQLLKLNRGRHHILQVMSRLASKILSVNDALPAELAVVMPLTNVGFSDAYADLMVKQAMQKQACGDTERDARDAAVIKEMTYGLAKWNEVVGWMYLHPELLG
ncbi:hypothetical protein BJ741DRAFT_655010 [Chytriomyces cf. hyalinus JEL632]|nr:hypothetical protein BJ741DRAFT_655010 [Chytriomyces cf. hyalinus JEL632]